MQPKAGDVAVVYRAPFSEGPARVMTFPQGKTIVEMMGEFPSLPIDFRERGFVLVDGHEIDRKNWKRIRVKSDHTVMLAYALGAKREGGGGGGKAILGLVLAVATVLTAGAALGGSFAAGGLFLQGSVSARLLAGGISLISALGQAALSKPPTAKEAEQKNEKQPGAASASGNVLAPGSPIPRVIGTRRLYPVLAAQPITVREGRDEVAEALFVADGPHKIEKILIGDADIAEEEDIEIQIFEGWSTDFPVDIIERYGVMKSPSLELSPHSVDGDNQDELKNQSYPERSLPKWHTVSMSSQTCDEYRMDLTFPQGLFNPAGDHSYRMPLRIRMRLDDADPWINLPEIHYLSANNKELRANIIIKWTDDLSSTGLPIPTKEGWVTAYKETEAQGSPASPAWTADASFSLGVGNDYLSRATSGSSNITRVQLSEYDAVFLLDAAAIPPGSYQVQIKRGTALDEDNFDYTTYTYSGTVYDPFYYQMDGATAKILTSREGVSDVVYLVRATSLFNKHPILNGEPGCGLAIIAVRAKNRALDQLSALMSGYVKDWDGTGWNNWTITSNPAPHFRDVLLGAQTPDPIDGDLVDEASILAFRQHCIDNSYTCDMICEGDQMSSVLEKIAGSGYARVRMSDTWGIIQDYDRTDDDPVQVFTARNLRGFKMSKAFARLPDAFRVVWPDGDDRDQKDETIVFRVGREDVPNPRIEEASYDVYKTEAKAVARASYDLAQGTARSAFFSWVAPVESIVCQRGDLVGINHYVLSKSHDSARVEDIEIVSGDIVAINLDSEVMVYDELDMLDTPDVLDVPDMLLVGAETSVSVRDHTTVIGQPMKVVGPTGLTSRLELVTPVTADLDDDDAEPIIRYGNLAWVGQMGSEVLRLIITDVRPGKDLTAQMTAVEEASAELFAA